MIQSPILADASNKHGTPIISRKGRLKWEIFCLYVYVHGNFVEEKLLVGSYAK